MTKTHIVRTGGMSESGYGTLTQERFIQEKLGNYTVLFVGPWSPEKLDKTAQFCREHGLTFTMDEMVNRLTGELTDSYAPMSRKVIETLKKYPDVLDGSLLMCEYGGLMFYWPYSTVKNSTTQPKPVNDFAEAAANNVATMQKEIAYAEKLGLPRPYVCIESGGLSSSHLMRAGIDRIDFEVTYNVEVERDYAAVKGSTMAFGKSCFGVDMAMVWYGGNQHDGLWRARWRSSLFHAFIRGADPIYAEHGVMDYKALGKNFLTDHPKVKEFRVPLTELADYAQKHPRPDGFPRASIACITGRFDGYTAESQTHLWGQRLNDKFRVTEADRSWELYERFYHRRDWESRECTGNHEYSGNPPLGQVDVIPFDSPDELFAKYNTLIFLGRNSMDRALYEKLIRFVKGGGNLLLCSAHLNESIVPGNEFIPFNGGDWTGLAGVKVGTGKTRLPLGLKFKTAPKCGWTVPLWSNYCDSKFTNGGFEMCNLSAAGAEPLAFASAGFIEEWKDLTHGVIWENRIGQGSVILVNSLEFPGAGGVRKLYTFMMDIAAESDPSWPKVECSDTVRYSVWEDRVYFLNTEAALDQQVILRRNEKAEEKLMLSPGEIREVML